MNKDLENFKSDYFWRHLITDSFGVRSDVIKINPKKEYYNSKLTHYYNVFEYGDFFEYIHEFEAFFDMSGKYFDGDWGIFDRIDAMFKYLEYDCSEPVGYKRPPRRIKKKVLNG
jgi:hypothetical protein